MHIIHQVLERCAGCTWHLLSSCKGQNNAQVCLSWSERAAKDKRQTAKGIPFMVIYLPPHLALWSQTRQNLATKNQQWSSRSPGQGYHPMTGILKEARVTCSWLAESTPRSCALLYLPCPSLPPRSPLLASPLVLLLLVWLTCPFTLSTITRNHNQSGR